jgi:hypothetical protein
MRRVDNEETLRTIVASRIGSGQVSEPNCRTAGPQQIGAEGRGGQRFRVVVAEDVVRFER